MNVMAGPGDTIRYTAPNDGGERERKHAASALIKDRVYTIARVVVSGFSSHVYLEGIDPHTSFNTVLFEDEDVDDILAAAREAYALDNRRLKPWDTDRYNISETLYAIHALLRAVMFNDPRHKVEYEDDEGYDIGVMLLAAATVGPDIEKILEFTGLPKGDLMIHFKDAVSVGIFTQDDKVSCNWFEGDGMTALLCDVLTVQGLLTRELVDDR